VRKYARYTRLEQAQRRNAPPQANAPFDIGAPVPIVLHASTVSGVRSHWVTSGQGIAELRAFKRIASGHSTFLDIGAGSGIFSAAFCALTGHQALAFEPSPVKFESLLALIELNPGFEIAPFNVALGRTEGNQAVKRSPGGAQFRGVDESAGAIATATMPVQTLDGFVQQHGVPPNLAKIDVDGMELDVLRGGAETFRRTVDTLMLEVHPSMLIRGESVSDLQSLLTDLGFKLFTLDFNPISNLAGLIEADPEYPDATKNIVCRK
jgi:FkbM family methyltransferase